MNRAMNRARVQVAGHDYSIGCAPGEEGRIAELANELEAMMARLKDRIGDVGDRTLAVMAGLTALDRLAAAEAANAKLRARIDALERAREAAALAIDTDDESLVARLEMVATTVDHLAGLINRDTRMRSGVPLQEAPLRAVAVSEEKPAEPDAAPADVAPGDDGGAPDAVAADPAPPPPETEARAEPAPAPAGNRVAVGRLDISPAASGRH